MAFALLAGFPRGPRAQNATPSGGREAVGPFPSWTNAKTAYRAAGDGVADDSGALQQAFDDLAAGKGSPVLFLPAGTYRITRTLTLTSVMSIAIVGEDPASTTIIWDGDDGGTMMAFNGVAYSRVSRLTFDGRKKAFAAIEQSWDGGRPHFDTGNEYSDVTFLDAEYGIHGGFNGHGFAETSIMRARFLRNTGAGIALGNFNALDIWIWQSLFEECGVGVTNDPGAGNFRVYDSVFRRSRIADLAMQNTGIFSVRGNYSSGSKAFFVSGSAINHPASIDIHGNTVIDTLDSTAIRLANQGPGMILDNVIRSLPSARAPIVSWRSFIDADMTSIGNTFTVATPTFNNGRLVSQGDRVVARDTLQIAEPALPLTPRASVRPIIEVAQGANAAAIQQAVDRAAAASPAAIVHLPYGRYAVDKAIAVPSNDVQIVGDGPRTVVEWTGASGGAVFTLDGPSRAGFRDLMVTGNQRADAIVAAHIDQPGARVYLEGVQLRDGRESNLSLGALTNATIDMVNSDHSDSNGISLKLAGGTTTIFSGSSSNNSLSYEVAGSAHLLARDIWYEGRAPNGFARVSGAARATFQGLRVATPDEMPVPAFVAHDFTGALAVVTTHFNDRIAATGRGGGEILGLSLFREFREIALVENRATPPARILAANGRQRYATQGRLSPGSVQVRDTGVPDVSLLTRMLSDTRSRVRPAPLTAGPSGATDLRLFRVWLNGSRNNLVLSP
jgi:hypothetical protein